MAPLETIIHVYRNMTLSTDDEEAGGCPLSGELEWDTILGVTHLAKVAVYLSDLYIRTRFRQFRGEFFPYFSWGNADDEDAASNSPWCDWPATPTEEHRIRTALLRSEIVHGFTVQQFPAFDGRIAGRDLEEFLCKVLPIYEAWEWEQISQIDRFLSCLGHLRADHALPSSEKLKGVNPYYVWKCAVSTRFWKKHRDEFRRNINPWAYPGELGKLWKDLEEVETFVPRLFEEIVVDGCFGDQVGDRNRCQWLDGSDTWQRLVGKVDYRIPSNLGLALDVDWGNEKALLMKRGLFCLLPIYMRAEQALRPYMISFREESESDAPWAWVDAMDGRNYAHVWGASLAGAVEKEQDSDSESSGWTRASPESEWEDEPKAVAGDKSSPENYERRTLLLGFWRRLGLVFWDKKRAEGIIAQAHGVETWGTGWLERWIRLYYTPRTGGIQVDHYRDGADDLDLGDQLVLPSQTAACLAPLAPEGQTEPSLWEYQVNC